MAGTNNRVELKRYIRFQLEQMSQRNDHHAFEALAFELARIRICSNLLPATGPVQAGGDQGRDFETFRTHLGRTSIAENAFVGRVSDKNLVFACTLNKNLVAKIASDIKTIFSSGSKVDAVYYFSVSDLPVAKRHSLIKECKSTHSSELEIFDGQAISDMLADADAFWIATQFLSIPTEMYPRVEGSEEYEELRTKWLNGARNVGNFAEFLEVKRGLRQATFTENIKPDLGDWIKLLRPVADDVESQLRRNALYEISVAQLRGRGVLDPERQAVTTYFETLGDEPSAGELEDAGVLVSYCHSATHMGRFNAPKGVVDHWLEMVAEKLDQALSKQNLASERYILLKARGGAELQRFFVSNSKERARECLEWWALALDVAEHDPFCEVQRFAAILEVTVPALGREEKFISLADRVDEIVGKREGKAAAAEQCRNRAIAYAKDGQLLPAIDQLQRTKEGWFAAETMQGSILAIYLLSQWYLKLNLPLAARYYAMIAMFVASRSTDKNLTRYSSRGALAVAETYLKAGGGLSALATIALAMELHFNFAAEPGDLEKHEHIAEAISNSATIRAMILRCTPDLQPQVDSLIDRLGLPADLRQSVVEVGNRPPWGNYSKADAEAHLAAEIGHSLFTDLGQAVVVEWRALGIRWTIRCDSADRLAAEELATILQIVQVDLANADLLILPSNVEVELSVANVDQPQIEQLPDNGQLRWMLRLPIDWEAISAKGEIEYSLAIVTMMLNQVTGLSDEQFLLELEQRLKRGLYQKAFWVRPAADMLKQAAEFREFGFDPTLIEKPNQLAELSPLEAPELAWRTGPASTYSKEVAKEHLENRYRRMTPYLRSVAPTLIADPQTHILLENLHQNGLLDWQIMAIIFNLGLQAHMARLGVTGAEHSAEAFKAAYFEQLEAFENQENGIFDPTWLTKEAAELQEKMLTVAASKTWNVKNRRQTPDFVAIKRILDERFNHSSDDIEHENIFRWSRDIE